MGSSFVNVCRFTPTAGGTTDWTFSAAVTGYQSPSAAGVINGAQYSYRAESADLTQWEMGTGTYNTGTGVLARTTVLSNSSGTGTSPGQSGAGTKINFSTVPQVAITALSGDLRELLGAARTYFIRSDGSDSNNGLANTAGGAFLTWAKAISVITSLIDFGGQTVTLNSGKAGDVWTVGPNLNSSWTGGGSLVIDLGGNTINQTSGAAVQVSAPQPGNVTVQNGTIKTASGSVLVASAAVTIFIGTGLTFGATGTGGFHMLATAFGHINSVAVNYTINGTAGGAGSGGHMESADFGLIESGVNTVTVSANLTFSTGFATATKLGLITTGSTTFSLGANTVTGPRFSVDKNSNIDTSAGGANFFPGNSAGTSATGGQYT